MSTLTNPSIQGRLRKVEKDRADARDAQLRDVMGTTSGRATFYWLVFDVCGALSGSFAGVAPQTDFNEGARSVGIKLVEKLQDTCGSEYVTMIQEQLSQREAERRADRALNTSTQENEDA